MLKNEFTRRVLSIIGIRRSALVQRRTPHRRMAVLEENGGWLALAPYAGRAIPREEWESLTYTTYRSDPKTFFAPLTSATGALELAGFWEHGKPDLDGVWTPNAERCPTIVRWVESIGARFGRVQLLRMGGNTLRECRWGLHLDDNNRLNPVSNGWVVRIWLELTDDPGSALVLRRQQFDRAREVRVALPRYQQVVVDSESVWHGGHHVGDQARYAVIVSCESGPELERWIASRHPRGAPAAGPQSGFVGLGAPRQGNLADGRAKAGRRSASARTPPRPWAR